MKTILVPVDFSDNSKNAMDYAILMANKLKMKLLLLHSYIPAITEIIGDSFKAPENKKADKTRKELLHELKLWQEAVIQSEEDLECNTVFTEGSLAVTVEDLISTKAADLIIMGTKGATGLRELFTKSNTEKVIQDISCPVIAVPAGYVFSDIKKIIFATDYHYSDVDAVRFMVMMAQSFDAELIIVHASDGVRKERFEKDLLEYFSEQIALALTYDKMTFRLIDGYEPLQSLNDLIDEEEPQLFALSREHKTTADILLGNDLTRKFVNHIEIPLLIFQAFEFGDDGIY